MENHEYPNSFLYKVMLYAETNVHVTIYCLRLFISKMFYLWMFYFPSAFCVFSCGGNNFDKIELFRGRISLSWVRLCIRHGKEIFKLKSSWRHDHKSDLMQGTSLHIFMLMKKGNAVLGQCRKSLFKLKMVFYIDHGIVNLIWFSTWRLKSAWQIYRPCYAEFKANRKTCLMNKYKMVLSWQFSTT